MSQIESFLLNVNFIHFFLNFVHKLKMVKLPLDQPSWLGHIGTTLTWFNFKSKPGKESNWEVLRLTC
jgi:hypothetical protein